MAHTIEINDTRASKAASTMKSWTSELIRARQFRNTRYFITEQGWVFSLAWKEDANYPRYIQPVVTNSGYHEVRLGNKHYSVHRMVAETWLDRPAGCYQVHHKDGNKLNNSKDNLEWTTRKEHLRKHHNTKIPRRRPIKQLSHTGMVLRTFPSVAAAAEAMGCSRPALSSVANGYHKTGAGYRWKWAQEA